MGIWTYYTLEMRFTTPLAGGVPRQADLVQPWLDARKATDAEHRRMKADPDRPTPREHLDIVADVMAATMEPDEEIDRMWVGFHQNGDGLYVRGASVRAHLKDCGTQIADLMATKEFGDILQFAYKFKTMIYCKEDNVLIRRPDGTPVTAPDRYEDRAMSVQTAQGPRQCLKRIDQVSPAMIRCTLQARKETGKKPIGRDEIAHVLEFGAVQGFNQDRSLGYGRYEWTLSEASDEMPCCGLD